MLTKCLLLFVLQTEHKHCADLHCYSVKYTVSKFSLLNLKQKNFFTKQNTQNNLKNTSLLKSIIRLKYICKSEHMSGETDLTSEVDVPITAYPSRPCQSTARVCRFLCADGGPAFRGGL